MAGTGKTMLILLKIIDMVQTGQLGGRKVLLMASPPLRGEPEAVLYVKMGMLKASGNLVRKLTVQSGENNTITILAQNESKEALEVIDRVSTLLLAGKMAGENSTRIKSETISVELARNDRTSTI